MDPEDRVLLFSGIDRALPDVPPEWFAVGGAVENGETIEAAAIRETAEETGLKISDPGPPIMTRRFRWVFEGVTYDQEETYFLIRTPRFSVADAGWTEVERATLVGHRWWTVDELRETSEVVYPEGLVDLLERLL